MRSDMTGRFPIASDWKVEQGAEGTVLHLVTHRGPLPGPRRPIQFALAKTPDYGTVAVDLDARPLGHSLMIVFSYRDPAHFDYAHLSIDPATKEHVHNGIFHVYGGERVRISAEEGRAAFAADGPVVSRAARAQWSIGERGGFGRWAADTGAACDRSEPAQGKNRNRVIRRDSRFQKRQDSGRIKIRRADRSMQPRHACGGSAYRGGLLRCLLHQL